MKIISANNGLRVLFYSLVLASLPVSALARAHASPTGKAYFQQTITGTVSDATGPLPGAIIAVKGTTRSVATDLEGKYSITASPGDVLVFSFTGYSTVEVVVVEDRTINISLTEDSTQLEELTINAGYYNVTRKESTGNIARVTAKDIEKQPVSNPLAALQGRMAGVDIIQDGGTAGGAFQIKIRGQNSLRAAGNDPLYIIDGVPYSSASIGSSTTSTATASQTSPLNNINPGDIESIEVLKDADATSIYGSRGSNGVVLITTKKGKAGKTRASFSTSTSFGKVTRFIDLMDTGAYLEMRRKAFENDGITSYPANAYDVNGAWSQDRYTDWQKELFGGTALITNYQGSVSGGSEKTQFLLSGNYRKETTVLPGDFAYRKASVRFGMNHESEDGRFNISFTAGYTNQDNLQAATDLTRISRYLAPNAPTLYDSEGNLNWENGTFNNPLAALESKFRSRTNDLVSNAVLSYKITPKLEVKSNMGFTTLSNYEIRTLPSTMYNPAQGLGSERSQLMTSNTDRKSWIVEPQLRWSDKFGSLSVDIIAGATAQEQSDRRLQQSGLGFASNAMIENLSSASQKNISLSEEILYRYMAYFSRANLNWDGRYIINFTARRDGSSRFGSGNRFANFGAIGAAWLFSRESFLAENPLLSFGKLRASYGTSGSDQIGDYQFLDTYSPNGTLYDGVTGLNPNRLYNPDFGWETNRKLEAGLEVGFFKDKVYFTVSYYRNRSSSQLVGIPLPGTTGFSSLTANLDATVQNQGFEYTLRTQNITTPTFEWSTSFNLSSSRNKLVAFPSLEGSTYANRLIIGESLNIVKLYSYQGVNPETGLYEFKDYNNDGAITSADRNSIADLNLRFFGGIQNQFRYKKWNLDFLLQFVSQDSYDYVSNVPAGDFYNQRNDMSSTWTSPGQFSEHQISTTGVNGAAVEAYYQYAESDATIVDGSYIRLKNVSLSYELPSIWETVSGSIFFQGQNLLTLTSYNGGDPEFRYRGFLPPLKIYSLGINLNF